MGDAGEGLIDAESRIQERMEEVARDRAFRRADRRDPRQVRAAEAVESLRLARTELQRQLLATAHEARRSQLAHAIEELDRRILEATVRVG
jgi:hypothetical protein